MEHHEHRFILYSLASAFLLLFGFTFVMEDFRGADFPVPASVGQVMVGAEVNTSSFVLPTPGVLSGTILRVNDENTKTPVPDVYVGIHRINTLSNQSTLVESVISDEDGVYVFDAVPLGEYVIRIESHEASQFSEIINPPPFLSGFSHSWNIHPVQIHTSGVVVTGLDFIVK